MLTSCAGLEMGFNGGVGRVEIGGWRLSRCQGLRLKSGEAGEAPQSDFKAVHERSSADDHMKCPQVQAFPPSKLSEK